jgi:hypothetical protein
MASDDQDGSAGGQNRGIGYAAAIHDIEARSLTDIRTFA